MSSLTEKLKRDRAALVGIHNRLTDITPAEYNALIHAVWHIDRLERELLDTSTN
jgi:hypothetical protein